MHRMQAYVLKYLQIHIVKQSVGGIMVSIAAFQAVDPGSIPGRRTTIFLPWPPSNEMIKTCFGLYQRRETLDLPYLTLLIM
jgi:hypothetical protein